MPPPQQQQLDATWLKSPASVPRQLPATPAPAAPPAGLHTPTLRKVLSFSSWVQPIATQPPRPPARPAVVDVADIAAMLVAVVEGRGGACAGPTPVQPSTLDELLEKLDSGAPIEWDSDELSDSEAEEALS